MRERAFYYLATCSLQRPSMCARGPSLMIAECPPASAVSPFQRRCFPSGNVFSAAYSRYRVSSANVSKTRPALHDYSGLHKKSPACTNNHFAVCQAAETRFASVAQNVSSSSEFGSFLFLAYFTSPPDGISVSSRTTSAGSKGRPLANS